MPLYPSPLVLLALAHTCVPCSILNVLWRGSMCVECFAGYLECKCELVDERMGKI